MVRDMERIRSSIGGRTVTVYRSGEAGLPAVYASMYKEVGDALLDACGGIGCPPFDLVSVSDLDWQGDLSPWPHDPIMRDGGPFAGGADAYIRALEEEIVPYAEGLLGEPSRRVVAGYSMGGLLAVYAPYRTSLFSDCVSASGSLWYPGFTEFAESEMFVRTPGSVYLSVGDREGRTRNQWMRQVEDRTRDVCRLCASRGVRSVFELNPGNHFRDPELRLAKGIAWVLGGEEPR